MKHTHWRKALIASLLASGAVLGAAQAADAPATLTPTQKSFRAIYQELIEINTTHSAGDTTRASEAMRAHLLAAGFKPDDVQVVAPFPRKGNLVARFKGSGKKKPLLLLAHIDVVEARRSDWDTDPFKLQEKDGYFIARGAVDDKAMSAAFVSVLAQLKSEGFKPDRDIILALTGDEERGGEPTNGAFWIVNNRRELIEAEYGINEGGRGENKDGKPVAHYVQLGEKSFVHAEFDATGPGGHSSRPMPDNVIYEVSEAMARLKAYQFPVRVNEAARLHFERSAALQTGQVADDMRAVGKGSVDPAIIARLSANPGLVGLLRTTCVATMMSAGHAPNALAQSAKATVNCRLLPDEDFAFVQARLTEIGGPKVKVVAQELSKPAPASAARPDVMAAVESISASIWPGVPVIPTMGVSTTDSRHFRQNGIPMYGVSGMFGDDANGVHGLNERIAVKDLYNGREFLYQLVKRLAR
ncbi:M20/M25/M40 family metallo-hydrolase [Massilia aurea]|uniref:M20/M25/M40 family metallo-hydrolase n=1 Tax=Massilia aurea TaxID=373040 RepID=UPI00351CEBE2